ncbi:DUF1456 family protein [uncultured Desulfobacter sp.]|uniref:DUF1456 family protein n=1 Tax=uncultured Desulfobacter sp. TaxID=240139 RepID=UPI002AAB0F0B|nr:DUF1456 family protein [uncultured Desulfobacter sp.]
MNNNDILRRVRYIFDLNDSDMISVFGQVGCDVSRAQVSDWLKKDDDPACKKCTDTDLAAFLNGLINHKRGKREESQPEPERTLNNNAILKKLKIAVNFKAEDMIRVLSLAGLGISKHELGAFFRKPGHKHYRECQNQMLRNFLKGLQIELRPGTNDESEDPWVSLRLP